MKSPTRRWVKKAESDLRVARNESLILDPERDAVCFHCQQAAEKYLKAILCDLGLPIPRIHDLVRLLMSLVPHHPRLGKCRRTLAPLTRYATEYRYPGFSASARQMQAALRHAERIRIEVRSILGLV